MATAATIIKQSLNEINVRAAQSPLEADEAQDALTQMNFYMFQLDAQGIALGYTEVSDLGDEVTIPDGAILGLISNLAVILAPTFDATVGPELAAKAAQGLDAMRDLGVSLAQSEYPTTLPYGSGNEWDWRDRHFFPEQQSTILKESGGSIGLETNTGDTNE